jgi:hypothetical protein
MPRHFDQIAADLDALTARDFDYANLGSAGCDRLYHLCDEMREINDASTCAPVMFHTMERLDDIELGTPGPLVHTLESWRGAYEALLAESIQRKPSPLTVWMVNRILNTRPSEADAWLALLRIAMSHPSASEATKADAADFLRRQTEA